jgi:hypothetical protein
MGHRRQAIVRVINPLSKHRDNQEKEQKPEVYPHLWHVGKMVSASSIELDLVIVQCLTFTMKVAYPHSHDPDKLESPLLSLKIARHSPCSICLNCLGLHPPLKVDVVLDGHSDSSLGDLGQYGSDDDDEELSSYFETCACGHDVKAHNANEIELGRSEFARRGRVACRLDELLQVS